MKFGFMYCFRHPADGTGSEDPGNVFLQAWDHVKIAEQLGFASAWVPEHHFTTCGYNPMPVPMLAALATQTSRMTIGTSILLLPLHNPVRLAEEVAAIDRMSGGRVVLGVGAGYRQEEFDAYNIDIHARGPIIDEALDVMFRLWTGEECRFDGRYFQASSVKLGVKPLQKPRPPVVLAARGAKSAARAARLGLSIMPTGDVGVVASAWAEAKRDAGREPDHDQVYSIMRVFPTYDPERDWEVLGDCIYEELAPVRGWYHRAAEHQIDRDWSVDEDREQAKIAERQRIVFGEPAYCVQRLTEIADAGGINHMILHGSTIGLPHDRNLEYLQLLADEVVPRLASHIPSAGNA